MNHELEKKLIRKNSKMLVINWLLIIQEIIYSNSKKIWIIKKVI